MRLHLRVLLLGLLLAIMTNVHGQIGESNSTLTPASVSEFKSQAEEMVKFLEFILNSLGSNELSAKEKDVIIKESYLKIFSSNKVQIEDDLDEHRTVPMNKDVQAYLKDVIYFFSNVEFTFDIQKTDMFTNQMGVNYIIVTLNRTIKASTVDGIQLQNNQTRYVEINLDENRKELKIASIYTTKLDEKEERRYWWSSLTSEWRSFLGSNIKFGDTLTLASMLFYDDFRILTSVNLIGELSIQGDELTIIDSTFIYYNDTSTLSSDILDRAIARILNTDEIILEGTQEILDIEPLSKFANLRKINLSNTAIWDLTPIRNLTKLEYLDLENSMVMSIAPLKYITTLRYLNLKNTKVTSIDTLANIPGLQSLDISDTYFNDITALSAINDLRQLKLNKSAIKNLAPIKGLKNLESIEFSNTQISSLEPISGLALLVSIKAENTPVFDLKPLSNLQRLEFLFLDKTRISDLKPLENLPGLKKVYCDQTQVSRESVNNFRKDHPDVLIIFESDELTQWWKELPEYWKSIFRGYVPEVTNSPTKEQLHKLTSIPELNLSEDKKVKNIKPLAAILSLKRINISKTQVYDLSPLKSLYDLEIVDCSNTGVIDLSPLAGHNRLERLNIENSAVSMLLPLKKLHSLKLIYADNSKLSASEVLLFQKENPETTIIYQTEALLKWWANMGKDWNNVFLQNLDLKSDKPNSVQLHQMADLQAITINQNFDITTLDPLKIMTRVIKLDINFTHVTDLSPISGFTILEELNFSDNPLKSLDQIGTLKNLKVLNVSNTQIRDLKPVANLKNIKVLKLSGTGIYNLKPLAELYEIEILEINNTSISSLKPLANHKNLRSVKCINTRISKRHAEEFKKDNKQVEVYYF